MKNTNIEWTDHTINFWWGCTKVSPACANCYAESVAKVFGRRIFGAVPQWGAGKPRAERLEKARLEALALNRQAQKAAEKWEKEAADYASRGSAHPTPKPRRPRVFVNSMSDWLDDEVPIEWLAFLLETISMCPSLDFQLLTKRPENWEQKIQKATEHLDSLASSHEVEAPNPRGGIHRHAALMLENWRLYKLTPPNIWIGTTVENQEQAEKRIPHLLEIPARIRFLSCEPLLGPLDLQNMWYFQAKSPTKTYPFNLAKEHRSSVLVAIDWVIAGGESGGKARPMHPDWATSLRDQCAAASVPFFFKQWGEWCPATKEFGVEGSMMPDSGIMPCGKPASWVDDDGKMQSPSSTGLRNAFAMARMGSKHTGRLLDGVEHSAFPA